jgi:tRNA threonylcarbamoyl adenosine modification protein YeaZ
MIETAHDQVLSESAVFRLALVTCGPQLEVALEAPSSRVVSLVRLGGKAPRSTLLMAAVDLLVEDAGLARDSIEEVVVSRGPGSFTGIRAGLATAAGIVAAVGAKCLAYDSLLMLAARCGGVDRIWSAQPGRRGEVYARQYEISEGRPPAAVGEIEVMPVQEVSSRGPWVWAEALDLGGATRAETVRSSAEALLFLARQGSPADSPDPLYVEGPPVHRKSKRA